jgi:Fe-S-cluster containining protein
VIGRHTQALVAAWDTMNARERAVLTDMFEQFSAQFRVHKAQFAQAEGIAAGIHDAVDRAMEHGAKKEPAKAKRVACRKGCAHCCHVNVDITDGEARLLIGVAAEEGIPIDKDHLRAQRDAPDFFALPLETRRCVFLKGNECQVYEHRPIACRKYMVLDRSDLCDTVKHPRSKVLNWVNFQSECMQSAAFVEFPSGSMPQMLLEWLP